MPKLPSVSAKEAIKVFEKLDYEIIGKGLLRKLLRDTELTVENFIKLL